MKEYTFNPDFFIPRDLDHAKHIILTPEDSDVDERWQLETEFTLKIIELFLPLDSNSIVLDWGCGIGRLSKVLIEKYNCKVVGIDLQPKMLEYAKSYVNSDLFETLEYKDIFNKLPRERFNAVIASWVFQHSDKTQYEIPLIYRSLKEHGQMFILECEKKAIPNQVGGYFDDNISTKQQLSKYFTPDSVGKIPLDYTTKKIREMTWYGVLSKLDTYEVGQ